MTDASPTPQVVQTYLSDEFGVSTLTQVAQGVQSQPFQYTGEQRDSEDGLVYLRARMYDPSIGRFLQRDPFGGVITQTLSLNRFAYASLNPVKFVDPSGFEPLGIRGNRGDTDNQCMSSGGATFFGNLLNAGCLDFPLQAQLPAIFQTPQGPRIVMGIFPMAPEDPGGGSNEPGDWEKELIEKRGGKLTTDEVLIRRVLRITKLQFRRAIHVIKGAVESNPDEIVHLPSGDVYDPRSGEPMGNLLDEIAQMSRRRR